HHPGPVRRRQRPGKPHLRAQQRGLEAGGRLQEGPASPGLPDQDLQGHQGQLLRNLRPRQGRQEGRDLLRPGVGQTSQVPMNTPPSAERVWDPFVRVFHWSLVSTVVLNQWVLEEGERPHRWLGYAAAALVLLRVVW